MTLLSALPCIRLQLTAADRYLILHNPEDAHAWSMQKALTWHAAGGNQVEVVMSELP